MPVPRPPSPRLARIRSVYVGVAVTVFNVVVLLLLVLLGLHAGLDLYGWWKGPTAVYSDQFDLDAYTVADHETAAAIVQEFDLRAMGEGLGEFDYQPWVGFAERPYAGLYLNVDEYFGYTARRTSPPSQASPEAEDLVVWTFGGSTMFGFGMNDDQTPASHLQRELQRLLPGYHVRVVNHAHGWWYSSQEIAHFLALLRIESRPQIVLFLDGVNDVCIVSNGWEPTYYASALWDAWEAERRRRRYPAPGGTWLEFTQSFPTIRLRRLMLPKRLTLQSLSPPRQGPTRFCSRPREPVRRVLEVYRTNRRIAAGIADALEIQVHFFLQPTSSFREAGDRGPGGTLAFVYSALIAEAREGGAPHFDSLHDVLDGLDKAYIDTIHYNEAASRILGERMAERIAQEWTSPAR